MFRLIAVVLALTLVLPPAFSREGNLRTDQDKEALMSVQKKIIEHIQRGEFAQAEQECKEGIEKAQKSGHQGIAGAIYGLWGGTYRAQKRYEEAAQSWRKAIEIEREQPKPDEFLIGMHFNNIGEAYRAAGENEKAVAALLEGRKVMGDSAQGVEFVLQNLGMAYARLNRDGEAEEAFKKSIEIGLNGPSASRSNAVESMYSLALLYAKQKRLDDCSGILDKAVPLAEKELARDDARIKTLRRMQTSVVARRVNQSPWHGFMKAGDDASKEKRYADAITSYQSALKVVEAMAPGSLGSGVTLMKLGATQLLAGDAGAAVESLSKSVPIFERNYDSDNEEVVAVRKILAMAKEVQAGSAGRVDGGSVMGAPGNSAGGVQAPGSASPPLLRLQPPTSSSRPGNSTPLYSSGSLQESVWASAMATGKAAVEKGDYAGAEKSFALAAKQAESFGAGDPRLAVSLNNLAAMYVKTRKFGKAGPLFERALPLTEKAFGKNSTEVAGVLEGLAVCRVGMRDFARALPLVKRVVQIKEPALGANHRDVIAAKKLYSGLARITGAPPLATSKSVGAMPVTGAKAKSGAKPMSGANAVTGAGTKSRSPGAGGGKK